MNIELAGHAQGEDHHQLPAGTLYPVPLHTSLKTSIVVRIVLKFVLLLLPYLISFTVDADIEPSLVSQEPHNGFISGCEGTREEQEGSDGTLTSSSEDGLFAKSSKL